MYEDADYACKLELDRLYPGLVNNYDEEDFAFQMDQIVPILADMRDPRSTKAYQKILRMCETGDEESKRILCRRAIMEISRR
jgi:hypothetical protein